MTPTPHILRASTPVTVRFSDATGIPAIPDNALQELDPEEVRIRAYLFWKERGRPEGSADEDWFRAEQSVRADRARRQPTALRRRRSRPAGKAAAARAAS